MLSGIDNSTVIPEAASTIFTSTNFGQLLQLYRLFSSLSGILLRIFTGFSCIPIVLSVRMLALFSFMVTKFVDSKIFRNFLKILAWKLQNFFNFSCSLVSTSQTILEAATTVFPTFGQIQQLHDRWAFLQPIRYAAINLQRF